MLEITNLHKQYKDFELDHISFQLPKGFIMGLVGKNGAGKSSLMKVLCVAYRSDSGEFYYKG